MSHSNYSLIQSIAVHNDKLAVRVCFKSHRAIPRLYVRGDPNKHWRPKSCYAQGWLESFHDYDMWIHILSNGYLYLLVM